MADAGKYGQIHVPGVGDDEPVFVLRAQDQLARTTIEAYARLCRRVGLPEEHAEAVEVRADEFERWEHADGNRPRTPRPRPGEASAWARFRARYRRRGGGGRG